MLLSQGIEFKFDTSEGNTFSVTGIYKAVPPQENTEGTPQVQA